jgi:hypothetical protein
MFPTAAAPKRPDLALGMETRPALVQKPGRVCQGVGPEARLVSGAGSGQDVAQIMGRTAVPCPGFRSQCLEVTDASLPGPLTAWSWQDYPVNDYLVAAHERPRRRRLGQVPEVKHHAYLAGASTTACGFGLDNMRLFRDLRFSDQAPAMRCPICSRMVRAGER